LGIIDKVSKGGRQGLIKELWALLNGRESYGGSREELTPVRDDLLTGIFLIGLVVWLLQGGKKLAGKLGDNTVNNYALSGEGWESIVAWHSENHGE